MSCIRPATPGFLATLFATGLLAAVSFGVPWIKSVYFLKATVDGFNGSLTFGTLGYCLDNAGKVTCSKPSVGYEIDINTLLGNNTSIQIPNVVARWITYCLVLHIVALALAAGSAVFGLLAHIREVSTTCCSTCISGFAAAVAMLAFIFDLALFFLTRARIRSAGGEATIGIAIWLTIVAWVLLFLSGIFFCCGRCCLGNRSSRKSKRSAAGDFEPGNNQYVDQVRMDAIKAEAERQAKQKYGQESGLPAFQEVQPLNRKESGEEFAYEEGNEIVSRPSQSHLHQQGYLDASSLRQQPTTGQTYPGGYVPGQPGGRAVDDYHNSTGAGYPPGPRRQGTMHSQTASNYSQSTYSSPPPSIPAPPLPRPSSQFLAVGGGQYGHPTHGSSYHSAISHQQGGSYDPYTSSNTPPIPIPSHSPPMQQPNPYTTQYPPGGGSQYLVNPHDPFQNPYTQGTGQGVQRAYTLGGSGYGDNSVLDSHGGPAHISNPYGDPYGNQPPVRTTSPTQVYGGGHQPTPGQSRGPTQHTEGGHYEDMPPTYDEHEPRGAGGWS